MIFSSSYLFPIQNLRSFGERVKVRGIFLFLLLISVFTPLSHAANVSHGLSMFGDLKYSPDFTHFDYSNPDAPKGGEVIQAAIGSFDSLNPYILKGSPAAGINATFDTLMQSSADEDFSEYGLIAETVEVADDRKSVIFNLRPEARWHDGSPITADDVVFSLDILKTKGHPAYRSYYRDIEKAEKLGEHKVRFIFTTDKNRELPLIAGQLPILSKKYYSTHDFEKSTIEVPLGSGPYKVEKVDPAHSITYSLVEDYWGKDLPVNKGKYNFASIRFDYYRDTTVAIEAFKAEKYDIRIENISKVWANGYNFPAVRDGRVIKEEIHHSVPAGMQGFILNIRRPKFQDARVREALNYAFDFEWENKNLFYSAYTRDNSYFANSDYAASDLPSKEELALLEPLKSEIPARVFTTPYKSPTTDGSGYGIRKNLLIAGKLLEDAGWVLKDGYLTNSQTGEIMKIEFLIDAPIFERVIAPFVANLKKLGIEAAIRTIDSAQYEKRQQEFDYDVIIETFPQSPSPGNEQYNYWHSSKADVRGSRNMIGIKSAAVDALVEHIIVADSREELITATRALDRVLLWNFYVIPNWYSNVFRVIYWDKFCKPVVTPKYSLGFENWWIKQE